MSIRYPAQARKAIRSIVKVSHQAHVHEMLAVVVVVAHASEIMRVVSDISIWQMLTALVVFSLWMLGQRDAAAELA